MTHDITALVALKTITLLFGGLITYFAYKAYSRSGARPLWYLSVGFAIVTMGTMVAGVVDQMLRFSILTGQSLPWTPGSVGERAVATTALVLESALMALGFGVIVYSLYTD